MTFLILIGYIVHRYLGMRTIDSENDSFIEELE